MEFNLKTKSWAGDLYHQLESICQDVDGLVNKDTMKSVGSQVQNVGISVKKICSDVLQDIFPLADDILKPTQQSEAGERTSTCTDEKKLSMDKVSDDQKMQISKPTTTQETQNCQYLRDNGNAFVKDGKDNSVAEKIETEDSKSVIAGSGFDDKIFSRQVDEDHISPSPVLSAHEKVPTSIEKERNQKVDEVFTDDTECLSETSSTGWLSQSMLSVLEDLHSEGNRSLSFTQLSVSTHMINQENCSLMDSPLPPACDADDLLLEEDTKHESVEWPTSDQLSEAPSYYSNNEKEQNAIIPSTCCTFPKSPISSADFSEKAENIPFVNAIDTTKSLDVVPSFPISESNDSSASQINRSEFLNGSCESVHEEHYKDGHSTIVTSPSETEHVLSDTIDDLELETIDLSPNSDHNRRSVVLNTKFALAGSHRRRNFKYYKNLIKGTFTSQKRLSKEYEHLGIMYDDIDVTHFEPNSLSSFPNTAAHTAGTQSSQDIDQWELL